VAEVFETAQSGARVTLEDSRNGVLSYVRLMPPGTGRAVAHVHLDFDQRFTVLGGHARYEVGGRRGALAPGERLDVPMGTAHVDPYPDGSEPLELRNVGDPEAPGARDYVRALGSAIRDGKASRQDEFHLLHLMVVVRAGRSQSFMAGPPIALQRLIIPILAAIGRLAGYRSGS
jgi:mannose-6-phosphate isomerase-like protein (cupin superfamily)